MHWAQKNVLPCEQPSLLNPLSQKQIFGPEQFPCPEQLNTFSQETIQKETRRVIMHVIYEFQKRKLNKGRRKQTR